MATNIPYSEAGMASWQNEQFTDIELFANEAPPLVTTNGQLDPAMVATADFAAFTVVGKNSSDQWTLADGVNIKPVGITTATVKNGAVNLTIAVWRAGSFNMDALNWHTNYATDAQRRVAFESSYAGAALFAMKRNYAGVYF